MKKPMESPKRAKEMFDNYLVRTKIDHLPTDSIQYIEIEKAFYAGLTSFVVMLNDCKTESATIENLSNMNKDISNFWNHAAKQKT